MTTRVTNTFLVLLLLSFPALGDDNWPQFRGHGGLGVSAGSPPTEWNIDSGKNVAWAQVIPGLGHSSPVVWKDRLFLTTAVNSENDAPEVKTGWVGGAGESAKDVGDWTWRLLCLDRDSGNTLWSRNAHQGKPAIKRHLKATHANCSVATDGQYVVAFFGSEGLYCYDFAGRQIWKRSFGKLHSGPYDAPELEWGFSSSPIIYEGRVIVQCDCLNTNFVAVLDIKTGNDILRIDRKGEVATWSTPLVVSTDNREQIVCNGYRQMAGYDLTTGEKLWHLSGGGDVPVPTPLYANGLIYLTNGHGRTPTYAIHPTATGDITPPADSVDDAEKLPEGIAWWQPKDGSYMPTPIIIGDLLYTCNDNGRLAVRNALTGELIYRQRVTKGRNTFSGSAVASSTHLYFPSESGVITTVKVGPEYELVGDNDMQQVVMTTPAIAGDQIFIRTANELFCIGESSNGN